MPLREYRPLTRETDIGQLGEFRIAYYVVCEGQNTEWVYFTWLCNYKRELGIHNAIKIVPLEKTGMHQGWSNPKKLFELAEQKRAELKADANSTYSEGDKFVVVFDLDIYNGPAGAGFTELLLAVKEDEIIVVTNPCFDIWLLLHTPDAYAQHIQGDEQQILYNSKVSNKHTYTSKKASEILGFNTKGNFRCESLLKNVDNAIKEERQICEDEKTMLDRIGCNMGLFITELRKKQFE
ncbi:hypothetical protein Dtox_1783 [Desulfofarcimen acetoxidans DSM 771]|jgi:hypothetical protein|uniref:RloB-like protein n=1 Tax=Desulfofarcimen acetoxidans (strain ATCC 49208 / DSM 771 / KCTC 5769 / VKM B-1644 / 5575) TaxID=485916 RepID=C8VX60_DESAS|nr:RloB family protein [Desulfofarcimen acetoxidans]ACV62636.1 hypothetical protein Dtox_1783 [Desulfofarcimen acetoxidans DSM 771]